MKLRSSEGGRGLHMRTTVCPITTLRDVPNIVNGGFVSNFSQD
jgi:hypothetical protein